MARFRSLIAAAVGGTTGSLARWGAVSAVADDRVDLTILVLNIIGSLALGLLLGRREQLSDHRFVLLGTGMAGGLTTFSTFAVAVATRLENGELLSASGYGLSTLVATLVAGGLGYRLSRTLGLSVRLPSRAGR